jgi:spore coat protein CotH
MARARVGSSRRSALPGGLALLAVLCRTVQPVDAQAAADLFNPDVVHRVDLRVHSQDWDKLKQNFQENTYYPADLEWNGQTVRNAGIRSRGLGSRSATKPGLRVDFDRYAADQTFLGLKSVVLDNLTQDSSGVRESIAMRLFARVGVPASRESFARLYVNNELIGLYAIVESVDKDLLARVFGTIDGNVQNDGYLFEYNYVLGAPWRFEHLGSGLDPYKSRFDPKTHENKSDADKWGPIEELIRMVNDTPSSGLASALEPRLDVGAFLRYVAAQNFVAENDGFVGYDGMNNCYLYRLEDSTRHVFVAWDEDHAFLSADFPLTTRHDENVLMRKVMESGSWRTQYFTLLQEIAESAARVEDGQTAWLLAETRRQLDQIAGAMREDPSKPYSNDDHAAARAALLDFANARIAYVRCEAARAVGSALPAGCS